MTNTHAGAVGVGLAGADVGYPTNGVYVESETGERIAWAESSSHAPLIAAAPEMYQALEVMEKGAGWRGRGPDDAESFYWSTARGRMWNLIVFRIQRPAL